MKKVLVALLLLPPLVSFFVIFYQPVNGIERHYIGDLGSYRCYFEQPPYGIRMHRVDVYVEQCTFWEKVGKESRNMTAFALFLYAIVFIIGSIILVIKAALKAMMKLTKRHLKKMPDPAQPAP